MRFVLHYRGPLRSNGKPEHKHQLRQVFHKQLLTLWQQRPLCDEKDLLQPAAFGAGRYSLLRQCGLFKFAPLATAAMNVVVELQVSLMRPEPPGNLITTGGDIDNRLKTLFDALTIPPHVNALPPGASPGPDETPFFCVLEDDNLVTAVAMNTTQLLEPDLDPSTVDLTVQVQTSVTRRTVGNDTFT